MKTPQQARQGDVLVTLTTDRPSQDAKEVTDHGRIILAYGEVTGHCHEVISGVSADRTDDIEALLPASMLFEEPNGDRFLLVNRPCVLRHDEHKAIELAPGAYKVTRQREYSPTEIRQVAD